MTAKWDKDKSLGANADALKNAGVTWKGIAELANKNGHEIPWPDGGKLTRARKKFLNGTEGKAPTNNRKKSRKKAVGLSREEWSPEAVEQRISELTSSRVVPWDGESTHEELLEMVDGKSISWVSRVSGSIQGARIPKGSKHTKIEEGQNGPYVSFASMEGPFQAVSFDMIIEIS